MYGGLKSIKKPVDPNGLFIYKNRIGNDDSSADLNCPKRFNAAQVHVTIILFLSY